MRFCKWQMVEEDLQGKGETDPEDEGRREGGCGEILSEIEGGLVDAHAPPQAGGGGGRGQQLNFPAAPQRGLIPTLTFLGRLQGGRHQRFMLSFDHRMVYDVPAQNFTILRQAVQDQLTHSILQDLKLHALLWTLSP